MSRIDGLLAPLVRHGGERPQVRKPWAEPTPEYTTCPPEHTQHSRAAICGACDAYLGRLLSDLPEMTRHLLESIRKDVRFAPRGWKRGDVERPDESPIPWNPAAARCLADLRRIVNDQRFRVASGRAALLAELSLAMERAHRVIDRPKDVALTMCPRCRAEMRLTPGSSVSCECGYAADWATHQTDILDANGDALLTMADLVVVLTRAGEPVDRNRINYLIRRHGLPREQITSAEWRDGGLVSRSVWVYRLRDVREMQSQLAASRVSGVA